MHTARMPRAAKGQPNGLPDWARALKARRAFLGKTQEKVAADGGDVLSQGIVTDLETGRARLDRTSAPRLLALARGLDWSPVELEEAAGVYLGFRDAPYGARSSVTGISETVRYATFNLKVLGATTESDGGTVTAVLRADLNPERLAAFKVWLPTHGKFTVGQYAAFDLDGTPSRRGEPLLIEHAGIRHVAANLENGLVRTRVPIAPGLPLEFKPDRILGTFVGLATERLEDFDDE
jgi:transcriptional regulator with XRE-family HTH domain